MSAVLQNASHLATKKIFARYSAKKLFLMLSNMNNCKYRGTTLYHKKKLNLGKNIISDELKNLIKMRKPYNK